MKKYYVIVAILFVALILVIIFYPSYPLKYENSIKKYSQEYELDGAIIASVIYAESGYDKEAESTKGAIGLMQLMPSTAQEIATKLGEDYSKEKMFEVDTNIKYGCFYLNMLINKFDDLKTALCSYNAGMGVVNKWLQDDRYSNDGTTLQTIPYKETQEYIEQIFKAYDYYKKKS